MDIKKKIQENYKNFVLSHPDYKNRGNIDEKKNKEEFKKLGSNIESLVFLAQNTFPEKRDKVMAKIEDILAYVNAFFNYSLSDQVRFNQKDREEIVSEISKIREALKLMKQISPAYAQRINAHIKQLNEIKALSGGVKTSYSDKGIYNTGEAVVDDDEIGSLQYRINNQMKLNRHPNYLPNKFKFSEE
jgi:hypothetical protein